MKTINELAKFIGGIVEGNGNLKIKNTAELDNAVPGDIVFLFETGLADSAKSSKASAIVTFENVSVDGKAVIKVKNPKAAMAKIKALFEKPVRFNSGVSKKAFIGKKVKIGKNVTISPHVVIGDSVKIGNDTIIYPNVTIYPKSEIGSNVIIHAGAVIGSDGFGYVKENGKWIKIPHTGNVIIGDNVEIGANVTIDRGAFSSTIIKSGTKLDNLIQIAHNCEIGHDCAITATVSMAGSVKIGDRVQIGGQAIFRDHVSIGSDSIVIGRSGVTKDFPEKSFISGYPAQDHKKELNLSAQIRRIPDIIKKVDEIEKKLQK